jgi:hypothetical protein
MTKDQLRNCLISQDYDTIVQMAGTTTRVLSFLTALSYDDDRLTSWRAIEAIGLAAARIADDDPEPVRVHLRRMQWLLNDESGGIGWRLPEAMGEIIHHRPRLFSEFVSIVITLFDLEEEDVAKFRPGILWAIGRMAQVMPEIDRELAMPWVIPCLDALDPQTRGMAVWCLGYLGSVEHLIARDALLQDEGPVELYVDGQLTYTSVATLVRELRETTFSWQ